MDKRSIVSLFLTSLGLAYLSNWLTDLSKDLLIHSLHLSSFTALSLVILMQQTPTLAGRLKRELVEAIRQNSGFVLTVKEALIALVFFMHIARTEALYLMLPGSQSTTSKQVGGKIKICQLKRCFG